MVSILDRVRGHGNPPAIPNVEPEPEDVFEEMTLQEHLEELRNRILYTAIFVAIGFAVGLLLSEPVIKRMETIAGLQKGVVLEPLEGFNTYLKVALYIGLAIAMPAITYHLVRFLAPGLTRREKHYLLRALPVVTVMFALGVAFAFFIVVPRALNWLHGFGSSVFQAQFRASEIVSFYMTLMLWIGVTFETPVLIYLIVKLGIVSAERLAKFRKYIVILTLIAAAMISPTPDPFNMFLVWAPLYALFEVGLLMGRFA